MIAFTFLFPFGVTVIVVFPVFFALIIPFLETVAIFFLLLLYVRTTFFAEDGKSCVLIRKVLPFFIVTVADTRLAVWVSGDVSFIAVTFGVLVFACPGTEQTTSAAAEQTETARRSCLLNLLVNIDT